MSNAISMARFQELLVENSKLKETIKGLDRATVEYTRIIAEHEETIKALRWCATRYGTNTAERIADFERTVRELNERIASLLEAQVSVPTRDVNGAIEAQQSLIRKLKGDVLTLQRKVNEQDDRLNNGTTTSIRSNNETCRTINV